MELLSNTTNFSPTGGDARRAEGVIFDIKHYAIHDGPGIRQTIFMKGCPLGCWWCHNPESRSRKPFSYQKTEKMDGREMIVTETIGKEYSVEELMQIIEKDRVFFEESGGGVTFSGGEPLLQVEFLMETLKECKRREIHTCIDTTGHISREKITQAAGFADLFLYDLKHMDDDLHRKYTGVGNKRILENLQLLDEMGKEVWIRYPLIPGFNDDENNLLKMLAFLQKLKHKPKVSVLPYHKIGSHKYHRFGLEYKMNSTKEPDKEQTEKVRQLFENAGFKTTVGG